MYKTSKKSSLLVNTLSAKIKNHHKLITHIKTTKMNVETEICLRVSQSDLVQISYTDLLGIQMTQRVWADNLV